MQPSRTRRPVLTRHQTIAALFARKSRSASFVSTLISAIFAAMLACVLTACGGGDTQQGQTQSGSGAPDTLNVVATTGMVADLAINIGGQHVAVTALMAPGVDPHLFSPTRTDTGAVADADVVLYNGLALEGRMTSLLDSARAGGERTVIAVAEAVPESRRIAATEAGKAFDPHVWMDPELWAIAAEAVSEALAQADPANAGAYAANLALFREELDALTEYTDRVLASVPGSQRVLITAHDAFGYFGRHHSFEVLGIQGLSTESEAGLMDIERLVETIVGRNIPAVFVESTVSDRNVRALITGARAKGHKLTIGGELFSDAMGPEGTYEGTYIGMIDHNATVIARALGGEAPARGMNGRLAMPEGDPEQ